MNPVYLKQLILLINDEKNLEADLCLDLDCKVFAPDIKPLIKVINYIINYLKQLSQSKISIGLSAQKEEFILSFVIHTSESVFPPFNNGVSEALKEFQAAVETEFNPERYAKVLLTFKRTE